MAMHERKSDVDGRVESDQILIQAGLYRAQLIHQAVNAKWVRKALYLSWRIIEGEHEGEVLFEAINAEHAVYKPTSKRYVELTVLAGRRPSRRDRLSFEPYMNSICTILVRTCKPRYRDGAVMPETLWYSVVDRIQEVIVRQEKKDS